jgi:chromosome segregation ATPase
MAQPDRLQQLRARLISVREQRNRMVHRTTELERAAAQDLESARQAVDENRKALAQAQAEVPHLQAVISQLEQASGHRNASSAYNDDWRLEWQAAHERLSEAEQRRATLDDKAEAAETRLRVALAQREAAGAELGRTINQLNGEIEVLMEEIRQLQATAPGPTEPDPAFRELLLDRLQHLETERAWLTEEISVREEQVHRIGVEATRLRSLLELHTPDWGRNALEVLAPPGASDRPAPAWRQAAVEVLTQAEAPVHYRDISTAIARVGQGLGGQDPAETLLAALSRDPEFQRAGRGLYWLKTRPLPAQWAERLRDRQ